MKTNLNVAIVGVCKMGQEIAFAQKTQKSQIIVKDTESIEFTRYPQEEIIQYDYLSGKERRRERRKQRKTKKQSSDLQLNNNNEP